ncbi:hypothetical protein PQG02_29005 [Nostoc sp. UHCC 0926]|uniref:hypothetical protein n=1 Tax=unclassified Nostoc TaxID=2593658 RepID=UPI00236144A6|nr:hypothetical protein [Nostoc sp. UHCC 0926]WDD32641.1 hypothetical protein PQG02_29005 [Nostoc sp. UHCC 0926]
MLQNLESLDRYSDPILVVKIIEPPSLREALPTRSVSQRSRQERQEKKERSLGII